MGKRLHLREGDGVWIGDDVFIEIIKYAPKINIEAPAETKIRHVKAVDRYGRPPRREPMTHGIMPAAVVLVAAMLLGGGGCGDHAARTGSVSDVVDRAVSRSAAGHDVALSGPQFSCEAESMRMLAEQQALLRSFDAPEWPLSVDPRDYEIVVLPELGDASGDAPIGSVKRAEPFVDNGVGL